MAANNWKEKSELSERVASARRKARFARATPHPASRAKALEMVSAELILARVLKNKIEAHRPSRKR